MSHARTKKCSKLMCCFKCIALYAIWFRQNYPYVSGLYKVDTVYEQDPGSRGLKASYVRCKYVVLSEVAVKKIKTLFRWVSQKFSHIVVIRLTAFTAISVLLSESHQRPTCRRYRFWCYSKQPRSIYSMLSTKHNVILFTISQYSFLNERYPRASRHR